MGLVYKNLWYNICGAHQTHIRVNFKFSMNIWFSSIFECLPWRIVGLTVTVQFRWIVHKLQCARRFYLSHDHLAMLSIMFYKVHNSPCFLKQHLFLFKKKWKSSGFEFFIFSYGWQFHFLYFPTPREKWWVYINSLKVLKPS